MAAPTSQAVGRFSRVRDCCDRPTTGFGLIVALEVGEIFGDTVLSTAILDRLLHNSTTINIKGESYRNQGEDESGYTG